MSDGLRDPAITLALRGGLALLFAAAAVHKLRDPGAFRAAVEGYAIVPRLWAVPLGAALIAVELAIATGLCVPPVAGVAGLAAVTLLMVYTGAIAMNLARGRRDIDCGCGGPAGRQPLSGWLLARNLVLAGAAAFAALPAGGRGLTWVDAVTVPAAWLALGALYVAADGLLANAARARRVREQEEALVAGAEAADG